MVVIISKSGLVYGPFAQACDAVKWASDTGIKGDLKPVVTPEIADPLDLDFTNEYVRPYGRVNASH